MDEQDSKSELITLLRDGDSRAMGKVFARYGRLLARLARAHLSPAVARVVDGDDVVQSVFRTFCRRLDEGQYRIDSSSYLLRLLMVITVTKAREQGRHHTAALRDVRAVSADGEAWLARALSREPDPADWAALRETVDGLLRGLTPEHARILNLHMEGLGADAIAERVRCSRRSVYRTLEFFRANLEGRL